MAAAGTPARTWQSLIHWFDGSLLFPCLQALPTFHRGAFLASEVEGDGSGINLHCEHCTQNALLTGKGKEASSAECCLNPASLRDVCPVHNSIPNQSQQHSWNSSVPLKNFVIYGEQTVSYLWLLFLSHFFLSPLISWGRGKELRRRQHSFSLEEQDICIKGHHLYFLHCYVHTCLCLLMFHGCVLVVLLRAKRRLMSSIFLDRTPVYSFRQFLTWNWSSLIL